MVKRRLAPGVLLGLALAVLLTVPAWAEEPSGPNTGALSLTVNLNFPTSYYFRGIAQNNAGFQFEPYVELKANVYQGNDKDVISGGYFKVAGFSHFQSTAAPMNTNYYEQDVYLSGGLVLLKRATLESGWNLYTYPGIGSSAQVQEVYGKVSFDDGGLWPFTLPGKQDFSLSPYVLVAGETLGGADGAAPFGGHRGTYMEFGTDPGYSVDFNKDWSARFHLPFVLGLNLHDYYEVATTTGLEDKTFGYADLALAVDIPLKFMPARYGKWTFTTGLHGLWLGPTAKLLDGPPSNNALNAVNVTGGNGFQVWGLTGVTIEY